jgi:hypothetical protein
MLGKREKRFLVFAEKREGKSVSGFGILMVFGWYRGERTRKRKRGGLVCCRGERVEMFFPINKRGMASCHGRNLIKRARGSQSFEFKNITCGFKQVNVF